MDNIAKTFENLHQKLENVENCIKILPHVPELQEELSGTSEILDEILVLRDQVKKCLTNYQTIVKERCQKVTTDMIRVQLKMMHVLQHLDDQEKNQALGNRALKEIESLTPKLHSLHDRKGAAEAFAHPNTPRMQLEEYARSPFVQKKAKTQLTFSGMPFNRQMIQKCLHINIYFILDFETEITPEMFNTIPAYMKGRITHSELQEFLDSVIIKTFNDKYTIYYKHRSTLKPSDFALQNLFKDQNNYFTGSKFITVGDLARVIDRKVEKKDERNIQMLRHIGVIKEVRKSGIVCYLWLK